MDTNGTIQVWVAQRGSDFGVAIKLVTDSGDDVGVVLTPDLARVLTGRLNEVAGMADALASQKNPH